MTSSTGTGTDRLAGLLAEHAALEVELADPAVHADQTRARRLRRRHAPLAPPVANAPAPPPAATRSWRRSWRPPARWTPPATTSTPPVSSPPRTPPSPPRPPCSR